MSTNSNIILKKFKKIIIDEPINGTCTYIEDKPSHKSLFNSLCSPKLKKNTFTSHISTLLKSPKLKRQIDHSVGQHKCPVLKSETILQCNSDPSSIIKHQHCSCSNIHNGLPTNFFLNKDTNISEKTFTISDTAFNSGKESGYTSPDDNLLQNIKDISNSDNNDHSHNSSLSEEYNSSLDYTGINKSDPGSYDCDLSKEQIHMSWDELMQEARMYGVHLVRPTLDSRFSKNSMNSHSMIDSTTLTPKPAGHLLASQHEIFNTIDTSTASSDSKTLLKDKCKSLFGWKSKTATKSGMAASHDKVVGHRQMIMNKRATISCENAPILAEAAKARSYSDGSEVVPQSRLDNDIFLESFSKLKHQGWYWGPISWEEAEEILKEKPDGCFLVRDSSDDRYILSLSFRAQNCTHHTRIEHFKGMFSFSSQPRSLAATTIVEFINCAITNSSDGRFLYFLRPRAPGLPPAPVRLLNPVSRFSNVSSLQHMCRFIIVNSVRRDHIFKLPIPQRLKDYVNQAQYYVEDASNDVFM